MQGRQQRHGFHRLGRKQTAGKNLAHTKNLETLTTWKVFRDCLFVPRTVSGSVTYTRCCQADAEMLQEGSLPL
ncbi:hypothetical protein U2A4042490124 [Corynebacterium striatum]|nr:hypothetical protein U2A4042490124 [Corynebacterium striatum]